MALALADSLHVADIAWIYSDVPRDYTLSELCIMSRFRPITPEDKGGLGRLFKRHVLAIMAGSQGRQCACGSNICKRKIQGNKAVRALMFIGIPVHSRPQYETLC